MADAVARPTVPETKLLTGTAEEEMVIGVFKSGPGFHLALDQMAGNQFLCHVVSHNPLSS